MGIDDLNRFGDVDATTTTRTTHTQQQQLSPRGEPWALDVFIDRNIAASPDVRHNSVFVRHRHTGVLMDRRAPDTHLVARGVLIGSNRVQRNYPARTHTPYNIGVIIIVVGSGARRLFLI